jgi:archaellum component FlaF (FlaF/FlaG flagellin family)
MIGTFYVQKNRRQTRMRVEALEERQLLASITVNTASDGAGSASTLSLRQAIEVSNGALAVSSLTSQQQALVSGTVGATNTIDFNIPTTDSGYNATTGDWTIAVQSALPAISTNAAIINGYSQTGASENTLAQADNAKLTIALSGTGQGSISGLTIAQQGSQVFGLDIENFLSNGVLITAGGNVQVAGCFIGTDPTGEISAPNGNGVLIANSSNTIGGPLVANRNLISGNSQAGEGDGILVTELTPPGVVPTGNLVENNIIGLDAAGTKALSNSQAGVADFGSGNTYGGTTAGLGNVLSGNGADGLKANGSVTVEGNYVGTDVTGNVGIGNGPGGIGIADSPLAISAITTTISGNVVSGNLQNGIGVAPGIQSTSVFTITNNRIGTNAAGTAAIGNVGTGLGLESVENTTVTGNLISDNTIGINLTGFGTDEENNVLQGNLIGTDITGTLPFGNTNVGVLFTSAIGDLFGGTGAGQGNIVAFNGADGVDVLGQNPALSKQVQITQNSIFGNTGRGIYLGINNVSNQFQMPPLLTWAPSGGSTGTLTATLVNGSPNASYVIEIYSNQAVPAQGVTFVQAATVVADSSGAGSFSVNLPTGVYTATATELITGSTGNTSQFALPASVTSLSSSLNPSAVGQSVTFTAAVTVPGSPDPATGTITFTIDGHTSSIVPLAVVGGVDRAQFTTSTLTAGPHTVSATYSGDASLDPSSGSLPTQTVNSAALQPSTTTVASSLNPSTVNQDVTFTAVVTAAGFQGTPQGTVTFSIDGQDQAPVSLTLVGGVDEALLITSMLEIGEHTITAAYSGDTNVSPSTGALPTQVVNSSSSQTTTTTTTTTTTLKSSLNPSTVGQAVTFTALVSPAIIGTAPTGTVTFTIDGKTEPPASLTTVNGDGQATFSLTTLTAGKHTISASYQGDGDFAQSATSSPLVQTVNPAVVASIPVAASNPGVADPPKVMSVQRFGIHMQPTVLVLSFNEGLDVANAQNIDNYKIIDPKHHAVGIASAVYNSQTDTVTLRPEKRINLHETYQLKVFGSGVGGLTDAHGTLLDGGNDGVPGSDYATSLTWRNVVFTPAEARKYVHPHAAKPAGALAHQFLSSHH